MVQWMLHPHRAFFKSLWACSLEYCVLRGRSTNKYVCIVSRFWFCKNCLPVLSEQRWKNGLYIHKTFHVRVCKGHERFYAHRTSCSCWNITLCLDLTDWWIIKKEREFVCCVYMREKSYSDFGLYDDDSYASILLINKILQDVPPQSLRVIM